MIAAAFCLILGALAAVTWAYHDLAAKHRKLEASSKSAARLLFRQRRRIQQLTADKTNLERHLAISHTVCDTLAVDLAEALHIGETTPTHDAVVVDLFAKQLEQPSEKWPL